MGHLKKLSLLLLCCLFCSGSAVYAQSTSTNYKVEEQAFGIGSELDASSSNYRSQQSVGNLGVGFSSSANYDAIAGFITPNEPYLEFNVSNATVNLGDLTPSATASGSATFYIRTYLSGTYSVYTRSQPLTSEGGATINPMATLATPSPGTEQFGINLVDNASPNVGANPINIPDNSFADGEAATDYDVPDQFKYVVGDVIARSQQSVGNPAIGRTDYTISYVANINSITEAGSYTMVHDLVAVPTF